MVRTIIIVFFAFMPFSCSPQNSTSSDGSEIDDSASDEPSQPCSSGTDPDNDYISTIQEGSGDFDNDTTPNSRDEDSDGDTIPDIVEAGDEDCFTAPVDSDEDGEPDFLDLDSDDNGIGDDVEGMVDTDEDGIGDYADPDNDGDRIPDFREIGGDADNPVDSDDDGTPDYMDTDSDDDGILDYWERDIDVDGDTIPSYLDDDSDGDGFPDAEEFNYCDPETERPTDTDMDGVPDFLDTDSDGDGLSDEDEAEIGTSRCLIDTDGDGYSDFVEWLHPTADPTDPESVISQDDIIVVLPPDGPMEERYFDVDTSLFTADVFFLVDTTGSMSTEIGAIRETLSSIIIPAIEKRNPDAWFGVGWFSDFSVDPYGSGPDRAFQLVQEMTPDHEAAQIAVNAIPENMQGDRPESQVEALYQAATGEGLGSWISPNSCSSGNGAPCFRTDAIPVILLFTDAPMHNGPPGTSADPYANISPPPHTWSEAVAALNDIHAKIIGLNSEGEWSSDAHHDLNEIAIATGLVDNDGNPMVLDIGPSGEDLNSSVVEFIENVSTRIPTDISAHTYDLPDLYDDPGWEEVDARCFIEGIYAEPGWIPPLGYTTEEAVAYYDESVFYLVITGTKLRFRIVLRNGDSYSPACYESFMQARAFAAKIIVKQNGIFDLAERLVIIIVPGSSWWP